MGAKVDVAASREINRLNALWKKAYTNIRSAQRDLMSGVDKQTATLQKKLGETQHSLARVKSDLNKDAAKLSQHSKQLENLKKQKNNA